MNNLVLLFSSAAVLFLNAVQWMVIVHVILSWIALFGLYIYIRPLEVAVHTLYGWVRKVIPTTIGPLDFAPVVVVIICQLTASLLLPFST